MTEHRIPIVLAADHAGLPLKEALKLALEAEGHIVMDVGTHDEDRCDYPDFADAACEKLVVGEAQYAVLVCGSGVGMSIAANRHKGVRCALLHDVTGARLCRAHNDANALALGARLIGEQTALDVVSTFLSTPYEGGRHETRLAKLGPRNSPGAA